MLKIKNKIKFNSVLENIVKCFIILLFAAAVFDKVNINYFKDIIVKLDLEMIHSHFIKIILAIKTFSFDLPIVFSLFVVVFNIICVTSSIIILALLLFKTISYIFKLLHISNVSCDREHLEIGVSNIYLINETFRC